MLTMVIDQPREMKLDKRVDRIQEPVSECRVLNVLIDSGDAVYTYEGSDLNTIKPSSFDAADGIRQVILAKAALVKATCGNDSYGKPREMICLIKLLPGAHYKSMIDILDEMEITGTELYSMQEPVAEEINELKQQRLLAAN